MIWIIWPFNICNFFCSGSQVFDHVSVLINYLKFTGKHRCWNLLLIELQASYFESVNFISKETPAQVFFCMFWEIFKKTFVIEQLRVTASVISTIFNLLYAFHQTPLLFKYLIKVPRDSFSKNREVLIRCFILNFMTKTVITEDHSVSL